MSTTRQDIIRHVSTLLANGTPFPTAVALAEDVNASWLAWIEQAHDKGGRTWSSFRKACERAAGSA